ncbi:MAG: hypothetical protein ABFS09_09395 [Thermodesulfobacteriota bacterium]
MPHFGLMDENKMQADEAALMRAKLHFRCGKRRVREGKLADGISTLYDALLSSMRWYALKNEAIHAEIHRQGEDILENDVRLQQLIAAYGAWPADLNFQKLLALVNTALSNNVQDLDRDLFINQIENLLTGLGVLPFDEAALPPEDPATF